MVAGVSAFINGTCFIMGWLDFFGMAFFKLSIVFTSLTSHVSVFYNTLLVVVRVQKCIFKGSHIVITLDVYYVTDGIIKISVREVIIKHFLRSIQ